jgi:riboflavin transporter FmnP
MILNLTIPMGPGLALDLGEIFVSLGSALGGPVAGIIIGFLKGIGAGPDRNIPPHMLVGAVWGFWYAFLYKYTANRRWGKWIRIAAWTASMPVYYYVLLLPLLLWIYATFTLKVPWWPLFQTVAPLVLPEMVGVTAITDIIWAVLPTKLAAPVK